jgi:RNA polymerase sigma-70 factor (ECF subfamily)
MLTSARQTQSGWLPEVPEAAPLSQLIARARASDPAALDQLFARCRAYLGVVARAQVESWLQAKADSSDLVQQTMMEAYRGFDQFHGASEGEWLAWLRRILEHNAADFVRRYQGTKRRVGKEVPLDGLSGDSAAPRPGPADPGETPSQAVARLESELQLAEALEVLTPDHREVIILRNLQRLPFDEVARRMERSRPAAQMLWMRAVQKLQELMQAGDSRT